MFKPNPSWKIKISKNHIVIITEKFGSAHAPFLLITKIPLLLF